MGENERGWVEVGGEGNGQKLRVAREGDAWAGAWFHAFPYHLGRCACST